MTRIAARAKLTPMMKSTIAPLCFAALLIGACTEPDAPLTTRPVEVKTEASYNGTGLIGYQPVTFRVRRQSGPEIVGAHCELKGSGFGATFLTPAIVMVPNFGQRSQDLVTYCRYEGQTATQVQKSTKRTGINLSNVASGLGTLVGGTLGGLAAGTISDYAVRKPTSEYGYTDTTILFPKDPLPKPAPKPATQKPAPEETPAPETPKAADAPISVTPLEPES